MKKKTFEVIEAGILSKDEMMQIVGGVDLCNPAAMYICNSTPKYGDCSSTMGYSCTCRARLYSVTGCVSVYNECGVVNGCGGSSGAYSIITNCPKKVTSLTWA